jgi:hypothetical protein
LIFDEFLFATVAIFNLFQNSVESSETVRVVIGKISIVFLLLVEVVLKSHLGKLRTTEIELAIKLSRLLSKVVFNIPVYFRICVFYILATSLPSNGVDVNLFTLLCILLDEPFLLRDITGY